MLRPPVSDTVAVVTPEPAKAAKSPKGRAPDEAGRELKRNKLRRAHIERMQADPPFRFAAEAAARLAEGIVARRKDLGIEQLQLAVHAKLPMSKIWMLEAGLSNATLRTMASVGDYLGLELTLVVAGKPTIEKSTRREKPTNLVYEDKKLKPKSDLRQAHIARAAADPKYARASEVLGELGRIVFDRRVEHHLTEMEVSQAAGVNHVQTTRIETATGNPTIETIARVAGILGLRLTWKDVERRAGYAGEAWQLWDAWLKEQTAELLRGDKADRHRGSPATG